MVLTEKAGAVEPEEHIRPQEARRECRFRTGGTRTAARDRGYNWPKAVFMAAEALAQAWSSDLARRAALKGSGWMGPS